MILCRKEKTEITSLRVNIKFLNTSSIRITLLHAVAPKQCNEK